EALGGALEIQLTSIDFVRSRDCPDGDDEGAKRQQIPEIWCEVHYFTLMYLNPRNASLNVLRAWSITSAFMSSSSDSIISPVLRDQLFARINTVAAGATDRCVQVLGVMLELVTRAGRANHSDGPI